MISCIVIDDEVHCLETMHLLLEEYCPDVKVAASVQSGKQGIEVIDKYRPDLVFLDIEMPMMNGFEMIEKIPEVCFGIIFTTSYDQYAIKAIRASALDYLLKPIDPKELQLAVRRAGVPKQLPSMDQLAMLINKIRHPENHFAKLAIPTSEGYELVATNTIISCSADDNYTHFFLKDGKRIIACRTLKEVEEQLESFPSFTRVHHSHIVNLNEVTKYTRGEGGYLSMTDGSTVNVSRSRKESLLRLLSHS
ncbi:MAG: LytTR family DNA-binding domain-containing protein [Chryseolinea sp.]